MRSRRAQVEGRKRLRDERGQAMAEMALVLPVLLIILIGILEFGRIFNYWIDTTHLANETARWVVVDRVPDTSPAATTVADRVRYYVCSQAQTVEERDGMQVRVQFDYEPNGSWEITPAVGQTLDPGDPIRVQLSRDFKVLPFLKVGTVNFQGSSTMRIERFGNAKGDAPATYGGKDWTACP